MTTIDANMLEAMVRAPVEHFENPLAVTHDDRLSHAQKEAILEAWALACGDDKAGHVAKVRLDRAYLGEIEHAIERLAELRRD